MVDHRILNIAVDLTGIVGMVFILISFAFNSPMKSGKARRLCGMLIVYIAAMLMDLVVCDSNGTVGADGLLYAAISANLALENLLLIGFVSYLRADLEFKAAEWRIANRLMVFVCFLLTLAAVTNPLHRLFFEVSPQTGLIQRGRAFPALPAATCGILAVCLYQVLRRKQARRQTRLALAFHCLLHIAALALQPFSGDTALVNAASLISMLVLSFTYYSEQNLKYSQQELELQNTRAALVLSQIQPHFLFNSMTAIMDLCDTDPREAKAALQELSDYLHYKISALSGSYLVSFVEDMELLQNYLKLEKRRFGDRLRVEYDIRSQDFQVPLLTLQPLVENAIRHGISKKPEGGTVRICTREIAEYRSILVEDDGVGFDPSASSDSPGQHVGLNNVHARLEILCGGSLTVRSAPGAGTTVEITIRKKQEETPNENTGRRR